MDGFEIIQILTAIAGGITAFAGVMWLTHGRNVKKAYMPASVPVFWVALLAAVIAGSFWVGLSGAGVMCRNKATAMGLPYQYSVSSSCMVQDDGRWIPIDQVINNKEGP